MVTSWKPLMRPIIGVLSSRQSRQGSLSVTLQLTYLYDYK